MPDASHFHNEHGILVDQKVEHEWRPIQCATCLGFGHETEVCRKKEGSRRWVKKTTQIQDQGGFTKVTSHRVTTESHEVEVPVHNTFLPMG